ncbi:virulence associated lipoprotein [Borreliella carolinensis]|uniref:virulence associated lipoprotein n=1 Tax=Borreliella carolinensis TaxID=478174 RepID=UPI003AEF2373
MKYNIIASLFILLFLACNPDFNINQKDMKHQFSNEEESPNKEEDSNKEESPDQRIKTTLLNNLRNLIEQAHADDEKYKKKVQEEPADQYGMLDSFRLLYWKASNGNKMRASEDLDVSKRFRKRIYSALNAIDDNELKNFSKMMRESKQLLLIFDKLKFLGITIEDTIHSLYSKKNNLEKLGIPNLKKVKNLFEQFLYTTQIASKMAYQLLLDYQNDENIKTDINKLESHVQTICEQMDEKIKEAYYMETEISSIIYE